MDILAEEEDLKHVRRLTDLLGLLKLFAYEMVKKIKIFLFMVTLIFWN